jgi:quinol monooxygenase YgiN
MSGPILYVDTSQVRDGRLADVRQAMHELTEFVRTHEPQLIAYEFYLSRDELRMTLVAMHPDAASMDFHLNIAGPAFRKFVGLIDLERIDVYGRVSEMAVTLLQQKAAMLGHATLTIHDLHAGFSRYPDRPTHIG